MTELIDVPAGLAGVAVADTEVGDVLGEAGYYHYRGRAAPSLADGSGFEAAAGWLLHGDDRPLAGDRALPAELHDLVGHVDVRTGLSALGVALGLRPLGDLTPGERLEGAHRLVCCFPTLVASIRQRRPVEPDPRLGLVADYLRMISGRPGSPEAVAALEAYFVLTLDHGFSNSTFATRVVASVGSDLAACALAGYASLSGPRHGANVERMLDMFDAIGSPDAAEDWLRSELQQRRRLQGFGHSVYRTPDPRLAPLRAHAAVVAPARHQLATAVEQAGTQLLAGRRLVPNVDLFAAVVLEGCGVPRGWFTPTFAAARIVGWCAHAVEQAADTRILRPAARYVGPPPDADLY